MKSNDVFLTFDDGPHPRATEEVLKCLEQAGVKATFFLTGSNVPGHESLVKAIADEGHTIGNHGYNHRRLWPVIAPPVPLEIAEAEAAIGASGVSCAKIFRPPYGFLTPGTIRSARKIGYKVVIWSTLTGDFHTDWPEGKIISTALDKLTNGSILVFHDNDSTAGRISKILPPVIATIQDRGFKLNRIE